MRARRRLHLKVAAAMLGLLVAFACAEAWFRFASPTRWRRPIPVDATTNWSSLVHRPSALEGLQYELNPGVNAESKGIRVHVNSLGLRGPEIALAKPSGTFRVAAIGDSVTFGFNVSAEDAWPAALERDLGERTSARVEALNFGVGGYSARDCAAVLRGKALEMSPDLVVYAYFLNDPETEPLQPLQQFFAPVAWWQHSALLRRIDLFRFERRVRVFGDGDAYRALHATNGPSWPSVLAALDSMKASSEQAHVPVLVAIFPNFQSRASWSEYPYRDLHEQVARAAAERGFGVLDLEPVFRDSGRTPVELGSDDDHPSIEGNRLAAHAIADWIAHSAGWPPKSSR